MDASTPFNLKNFRSVSKEFTLGPIETKNHSGALHLID